MLGPYTANKNRSISYNGNNLFGKIKDIVDLSRDRENVEKRVSQFNNQSFWASLARINHRINLSSNNYFDELGALFTLLPLTTRMISSPGAVYGKEAINYTTDTCPITLKWFDLPREAFLSESSQIYLELALMQKNVNHVYSIYNSFRKEKADAIDLSEFHHLEYEGKVSQRANEKIALGLVGRVVGDLLKNNEEDLSVFLNRKKINSLNDFVANIHKTPRITYLEAQKALQSETKDDRYKVFTMQNNFGSWEEVKLTEIFGGMVGIREFPLLEVPFYHARVDGVKHNFIRRSKIKGNLPIEKKSFVADNTDFIWPSYRETIGSGHRVRSKKGLEEKARIFNLPLADYQPYLQTRQLKKYAETSGFGLGWERMLQGLLEMPTIVSVAHFPRIDTTLKP